MHWGELEQTSNDDENDPKFTRKQELETKKKEMIGFKIPYNISESSGTPVRAKFTEVFYFKWVTALR